MTDKRNAEHKAMTRLFALILAALVAASPCQAAVESYAHFEDIIMLMAAGGSVSAICSNTRASVGVEPASASRSKE